MLFAAFVLQFIFLSVAPLHASAEHKNLGQDGQQCGVPLPDPEKLSEEEKAWFRAFQEGTFYVQGWKDITAEVLEKIQQKEVKDELRQTLTMLGIRIGCEWSKDNDIRKINNDMLEQWGDRLQKIAEEKPHELPVVIADIRQQVVALLE